MNNNKIEQIKQFLHNEICERRDYSASKMCEETLKFIEQMENTTLNQLIKLYENQITQLTVMSKIELGDDVIEEINKLKSQLLGGEIMMGRNNTNPGTSIDMDDLRSCISLYLNDIESYGRVGEHEESINVLNDFVEYIDSMNGRDATPIIEKQNIE